MEKAHSLEFSDRFMVSSLADFDDLVETLRLWLEEGESPSCVLTKLPNFKSSHYANSSAS